MAKLLALITGGYSDTERDYMTFKSKREMLDYFQGAPNYAFDKSEGNYLAHVFNGSRSPWSELDPYPDHVVEVGARGGLKLTPA